MRSAGRQRAAKRLATPTTPPGRSPQTGILVESPTGEGFLSRDDTLPARLESSLVHSDEAHRMLELAIRQRIKQRLAGRVRNLEVRVFDGLVILEGECATYYTKQLAQHTALGILEDEHLENAIVVTVPR
jgi:hypothetical protein